MSDTQQLLQRFSDNHKTLMTEVDALPEADFTRSQPGKWTPGQHLQHIHLVLQSLLKPISAKDAIRGKFGPLNRPDWDEQALIAAYLKTNRQAPERSVPGAVVYANKEAIISGTDQTLAALMAALETYSEEELDGITLPHPLLGLLSVRELVRLMAFHAPHHLRQIQESQP